MINFGPTNPLLRAENQVSSKIWKMWISQKLVFTYAMGNGFAILIPFGILSSSEVAQSSMGHRFPIYIPFSILNRPEVAQFSSKGWELSLQQKL